MSVSLLAIMFDHIIGLFLSKHHNTDMRSTFLRRWLDLLQTPLLLASVLTAIGTEPWIGGTALSISGLVCLADTLLTYHLRSHHVDVISLPLRARMFCTGIYASACVFNLWPKSYPLLPHLFPKVVGMVILYVAFNSFLRVFRYLNQPKYWTPLIELSGLLMAMGYLFQAGFFSYPVYLLGVTFLTHRMSGAFLLHAHIKRAYRGRDRAVYAWMLAFFWFAFACHPIPLNFLCNKLSFCQTRDVGGFSVQSVLPLLFCANMMRRSVKECYQKLNLSEDVYPGRNHIFKAVGITESETATATKSADVDLVRNGSNGASRRRSNEENENIKKAYKTEDLPNERKTVLSEGVFTIVPE